VLGLADDLQREVVDPFRTTGELKEADELPVLADVSPSVESLSFRLIGFLPLLRFRGRVGRRAAAFMAASCTSGSWSQAVPATLILRKRIELLVNVPVLSEKM
jgi:hypothetical protein